MNPFTIFKHKEEKVDQGDCCSTAESSKSYKPSKWADSLRDYFHTIANLFFSLVERIKKFLGK